MDHWLQTGYMSENHCKKPNPSPEGFQGNSSRLVTEGGLRNCWQGACWNKLSYIIFLDWKYTAKSCTSGDHSCSPSNGMSSEMLFLGVSQKKKKKVSSFTCECYLLQERIIVFLLLHISRRHLEALPCPFHCAVAVGILTHSLHLF